MRKKKNKTEKTKKIQKKKKVSQEGRKEKRSREGRRKRRTNKVGEGKRKEKKIHLTIIYGKKIGNVRIWATPDTSLKITEKSLEKSVKKNTDLVLICQIFFTNYYF
jgi:hypothetical protein